MGPFWGCFGRGGGAWIHQQTFMQRFSGRCQEIARIDLGKEGGALPFPKGTIISKGSR